DRLEQHAHQQEHQGHRQHAGGEQLGHLLLLLAEHALLAPAVAARQREAAHDLRQLLAERARADAFAALADDRDAGPPVAALDLVDRALEADLAEIGEALEGPGPGEHLGVLEVEHRRVASAVVELGEHAHLAPFLLVLGDHLPLQAGRDGAEQDLGLHLQVLQAVARDAYLHLVGVLHRRDLDLVDARQTRQLGAHVDREPREERAVASEQADDEVPLAGLFAAAAAAALAPAASGEPDLDARAPRPGLLDLLAVLLDVLAAHRGVELDVEPRRAPREARRDAVDAPLVLVREQEVLVGDHLRFDVAQGQTARQVEIDGDVAAAEEPAAAAAVEVELLDRHEHGREHAGA